MKKCKPVSVRESWVMVPQPHLVPREVGIVLLIGSALAIGFGIATVASRNAHAATPNLVVVPEYSDTKANDGDDKDDEYPKPELKYQYEPADPDYNGKPVLHKKVQQEEVAGGAEYDSGDELVVEPESNDLAISPAPIIETDLSQGVSAPTPSPSPSLGTDKVKERDIGRRTAEVR